MAVFKITTFILTYWILSSCQDYILPVITYFTNWILLLVISWTVGAQITKRILLKKVIPKIDPHKKAVLITGMPFILFDS